MRVYLVELQLRDAPIGHVVPYRVIADSELEAEIRALMMIAGVEKVRVVNEGGAR